MITPTILKYQECSWYNQLDGIIYVFGAASLPDLARSPL